MRELSQHYSQLLRQRAQDGLTTLEWLLIVAAVAGLAALAVVLVQNVVDDTAEEITGNNARETAAKVAANRINSDAINAIVQEADPNKIPPDTPTKYEINDVTHEAINDEAASKCNRLNITYSDVDLSATWANNFATKSADFKTDETTTRAALRAALEGEQPGDAVGCKIP